MPSYERHYTAVGQTFYVPHPKARRCKGCGRPADPGDIEYVHAQVGAHVGAWCIACFRIEKQRAAREISTADPTYYQRLERLVERHPKLLEIDCAGRPLRPWPGTRAR